MNLKKLSGYALGPVGSAAVGIITLPFLSWFYPAEDIARIMLLQTIASLTLVLTGFGLDQAYIREYHSTANKAVLFKTIFLLPLAITALMCVVIVAFPLWEISDLILDVRSNTLDILCLIFFTSLVLVRYLSLILRMNERAFAFSFSQLAPKLLVLVLLLVFSSIGFPSNTLTLVSTYAAAQLLTVFILVFQTKNECLDAVKSPIDISLLKQTLHYGIPLAIGGIAYWAFISIDRFILKQYNGLSELGIYSMALNFGAVALILQNIFAVIWAPMVFRWVEENKNLENISSITLDMSSAITAIICLVGIFSPLVFLILPSHYASVQFILLSSMMFPLLYTLTEVSGIGLNVIKRTWLITAVNIIAFLVNFCLLHLLTPALGARGAAISIAISFWIFFLMKTELSSRLWQPLPRQKVYTQTTLCLILSLSYTYIGNKTNHPFFALVWLIILAVLLKKYYTPLKASLSILKNRTNTKNTTDYH